MRAIARSPERAGISQAGTLSELGSESRWGGSKHRPPGLQAQLHLGNPWPGPGAACPPSPRAISGLTRK